MTFSQKIKQPLFWKNIARIAIPFFIILTIISLLLNSWKAIFSGDFQTLIQANFSEGKWKRFWGFKIIFSFIYGLWITNKKMK